MDILADYLEFRDFSHSRLDGSMSMTDRQVHIEAFNEDPDRFVFLLSTRAGGLGLNLMAADTGEGPLTEGLMDPGRELRLMKGNFDVRRTK